MSCCWLTVKGAPSWAWLGRNFAVTVRLRTSQRAFMFEVGQCPTSMSDRDDAHGQDISVGHCRPCSRYWRLLHPGNEPSYPRPDTGPTPISAAAQPTATTIGAV